MVGTMNPEEGELRPQLLDRFGLFVEMPAVIDGSTRQDIVRNRLLFDADPKTFLQQYALQQKTLYQRIVSARTQLNALTFPDEIHQKVSDLCCAAQVEGVRADLVLLRAARAHAALLQRSHIDCQDIDAVEEWALAHRRRAQSKPESKSESDPSHPRDNSANGTNQKDLLRVLAPEPVPLLPVKDVRPLATKKP